MQTVAFYPHMLDDLDFGGWSDQLLKGSSPVSLAQVLVPESRSSKVS
jgi:hypothetical protein